ncbi:hypothetical protein KUL25_18430 [Rhodobacteraceae bacterium N5(2021)]|uniref:PaaX family transcriptional regulator n=1 Tax=Gymnodinialimonas phycosphaerae TaxID=2841589 RepID=A0A975TTG7_9RHOB|nr:hypothetical protein [Gymnodinialimonas phycosphaerae]
MSDPVRQLAEALEAQAPLKLWSVLVSCLGDVSQEQAVEVSGIALSALVERVGLQPQAMRVALHRLKRDGWVESRRDGRVGFHRLSASALAQTWRVAGRIYGPAAGSGGWHLVGMPPDMPDGLTVLPDSVSAVAISRSFALAFGPVEDMPKAWLVTAPGPRGLPGWVRDVVAEAGCEREFLALEAAVAAIGALPDDPLDRLALRVLVLHGWRRLILRSNPAAEMALGETRAEIACRATVHGILESLGPTTQEWLQVAS